MQSLPTLTPEALQALGALLTNALAQTQAPNPAPETATASTNAGTTPADAQARPDGVAAHRFDNPPELRALYKSRTKHDIDAIIKPVAAQGYNVLKSWPLIVVGLILCALVWHIAPAKMLLIAYGLAKGVVFALSGALTDYLLFPDDAPEALEGVAQGTSWKRRSLIVFGFLIVAAMLP